jgi:predicted ATPase
MRVNLLPASARFWQQAVFLRLSPNRLAGGSRATRRSFDPLLDEEGQTLAALLYELSDEQRQDLADDLAEILEGIRDVEVSTEGSERNQRANYGLLERMPYRGRAGKKQFPIPAWMLSEGTRRITALLALLKHDIGPSLLCIEEIENGLDPWTVRQVLRQLESAADRGVQVIMTTHSPWLLDEVPLDSILQVRRIEGDTQYEHFASRKSMSTSPVASRFGRLRRRCLLEPATSTRNRRGGTECCAVCRRQRVSTTYPRISRPGSDLDRAHVHVGRRRDILLRGAYL